MTDSKLPRTLTRSFTIIATLLLAFVLVSSMALAPIGTAGAASAPKVPVANESQRLTPSTTASDSLTYRVNDRNGGNDTATASRTVSKSDTGNDRFEPNDEADTAEPIASGEDLSSLRIVESDIDGFKVNLSEGETPTASINFDHDDADLQLAAGNIDPVEERVYAQSTSTTDRETISITAAADEPYYITVESRYNNTANYSLTTAVSDEPETGFISGQIKAELTAFPIAETTVEVTDSSGTTVAQTVTGERGEYTVKVPTGDYTVSAEKRGYQSTSVDVSVTDDETVTPRITLLPLNDEFEPNDDFDSAPKIESGRYTDLQITSDDEDYFAVDLSEGDSLSTAIAFEHIDGDLNLAVHGPNGEVLAESTTTTDDEAVSLDNVDTAGTYYVHVDGYEDASAWYDLEVDVSTTEERVGSISEVVTDVNNVALSETSVVLQEDATGDTIATTTTDQDGSYSFTGVPTGEYLIEAEYNGETGAAQATVQDGRTTTASVVVLVEAEVEASFQVQSLTPGDVSVTSSESLGVAAEVENTGGTAATQTVELRIAGETIATETISLDAGERQSISFSGVEASSLSSGQVTYGVYTEEDRQTATVTVDEMSRLVELDVDAEQNVAPGEQFAVTYTLRNIGDTAASGGGLQITAPDELPISSVSGDGTNSPDRFYITTISTGDAVSTTYTFTVPEDATTGTATITATGALHDQQTNATATVEITETGDLPTEDPSFPDVLEVIDAYSSGSTYDGADVGFQEVLEVIDSYAA